MPPRPGQEPSLPPPHLFPRLLVRRSLEPSPLWNRLARLILPTLPQLLPVSPPASRIRYSAPYLSAFGSTERYTLLLAVSAARTSEFLETSRGERHEAEEVRRRGDGGGDLGTWIKTTSLLSSQQGATTWMKTRPWDGWKIFTLHNNLLFIYLRGQCSSTKASLS